MGIPSGSVAMNPPAVQEMQLQSLGWEEYSCQKNPMDRGAWRATAHGVKSTEHSCVTKRSTAHNIMIGAATC